MKHSFLYLHFGGQCPWYLWMLEQVTRAAREVEGEVRIVDVMDEPSYAADYRMYFPFMTIIDDFWRIPAQVAARDLVSIAEDGLPGEPTVQGPKIQVGRLDEVRKMTLANIQETCPLCVPYYESRGCRGKKAWASSIVKESDNLLGYIGYKNEHVLAAVEMMPATEVPYPLEDKDAKTAFITCLYSQSGSLDYRADVLAPLIRYLQGQGLNRIQVIAGNRTAFPNGPAAFFEEFGFENKGEIDRVLLKKGTEEIYLMEKEL